MMVMCRLSNFVNTKEYDHGEKKSRRGFSHRRRWRGPRSRRPTRQRQSRHAAPSLLGNGSVGGESGRGQAHLTGPGAISKGQVQANRQTGKQKGSVLMTGEGVRATTREGLGGANTPRGEHCNMCNPPQPTPARAHPQPTWNTHFSVTKMRVGQ